MKKSSTLFYPILIFVIAQLAWFILLSLWIYWYVTNHLLLDKVGDELSPQIISGGINIAALVSGIVMLMVLSLILTLFFIYLNRQMNVTRQYDNFIANVTHELKSPLSSIQLYLETMRKHDVPPIKQNEFLTLMLTDIERLNQLISSILYLSSLEQRKIAKKVTHDYHVYETDTIIHQVIKEALAEIKFPQENVEIIGEANCECVIDRNWLKIVFNNLIDNALKYSKNPARIKIQLSQGIKYFYIEFSDQGIGIASNDQKKVFNKFQRIYNPESPNVKGTGLGLYWVKEIIEYHGGKINVTRSGKNKGTTFKIALPIYKAFKRRYMEKLLQLSKKSKPMVEIEDE